MANRPANQHEKQFLKDMTDFINDVGVGVLFPGYEQRTDIQRHHVLGKSAKHNKVHIGYYFVFTIPIELHDVDSNHHLNVTNRKNAFVKEYGKQSDIFYEMITLMGEYGYMVPPEDVVEAIMDTGA